MDWNTVAETIVKDDRNKWDRKVSAEELRVSESGALELAGANGNSGSFPLSDLAASQMRERLGQEKGSFNFFLETTPIPHKLKLMFETENQNVPFSPCGLSG